MPDSILADYHEAASILSNSPRGAAALLRLCIQKLLDGIGAGANLNDAIAHLSAKGLDPHIIEAMDVLRVVGNNAVHPLEMDLHDDAETATSLFGLLNLVVDELIGKPNRTAAMLARLPEGARRAIEQRNAKAAAKANPT
jgi:hypothetical protein